uniref:Protein SPT2 homolog n=1 Tax=Lygus hesperus TaxID=30085 RepID=A0A0A9XSF3_LYGHE
MDYGELLYKAQQNERNTSKQDVRCYKSGFAPPKKLERTVSTANVKKFLARKETEEKHKQMEAKKKKEELLALRSQDKKAKRRVEFMLKRTKSANYSVMEDAIDNNNTADTLEGPMQCDEDDYGYVSQEASAFYAKLMNKYSNMPAEPSPFSKTKREVKDLSAAKDRVRAALKKEEEEAELPHKRKRKHKEGDAEDGKEEETSNSKDSDEKSGKSKSKEKSEKPQEHVRKKQNNVPPPPSFEQLLKLAEEKKSKPVNIDEFIRNNAPKEPDRPMTQKEKIEWQREQERKMNRDRREKGLPPLPSRFEDSSKSRKPTIPKILKNEGSSNKNSETKDRPVEVTKKVNGDTIKKVEASKSAVFDKTKSGSSSSSSLAKKVDDKNKSSGEKKVVKFEEPDDEDALGDIERQIELLKRKKMMIAQKKAQAQAAQAQSPKLAQALTANKQASLSDKPKSNSAPIKTSQLKLPAEKSRTAEPQRQKVPPSQNKPKTSGIPPQKSGPQKPAGASQILRPSYLPPTKPKDKFNKKPKRRIDSESEYDSELDDFIEDEDEGEADYSSYIKEIFGYDKSRYKNVDDEDECMESNFAQQMREEFVSTKIGIMEDLEDIKKEQEEKKRLKAKKMKGMKGK